MRTSRFVDAAKHEDRVVSRRCRVCGKRFEAPCYPRTGANQMLAREETALELAAHIKEHTVEDLVAYVKGLHQV